MLSQDVAGYFLDSPHALCYRSSSYISVSAEETVILASSKCLTREIVFDLLMEFRVKYFRK